MILTDSFKHYLSSGPKYIPFYPVGIFLLKFSNNVRNLFKVNNKEFEEISKLVLAFLFQTLNKCMLAVF